MGQEQLGPPDHGRPEWLPDVLEKLVSFSRLAQLKTRRSILPNLIMRYTWESKARRRDLVSCMGLPCRPWTRLDAQQSERLVRRPSTNNGVTRLLLARERSVEARIRGA